MYPVYDKDGTLMAIFSDKESVQRLLGADFDCTTEGATQIGAEALDLAGEQRNDGQVEAGEKPCAECGKHTSSTIHGVYLCCSACMNNYACDNE